MQVSVQFMLLVITSHTPTTNSFVLTPDADECPVKYPCFYQGTSILCSQGQLNTFPVFKQARKSWTLFINYNNISVIPDGALKNIKVKELIMDMMNLGKPVTIHDNAFQGQELTLEKISMVDCGLTELPPAFRKLNALTDLSVNTNSISKWDDAAMKVIGQRLTRFSAAFFEGDTYTWPAQFNYLKYLEYLDLSGSTRFVPDLDKLITFSKTLTKLILARMEITEVPPVLKHLPGLTELDLGHNQMNESGFQSDSFTAQTHLQYLTLSYNKLQAVPDGLTGLTAMTFLDVSGNPWTSMDTAKLPSGVVQLIADHGKLTSVPTNLQRLHKLERLLLYTNAITTIHKNDLNNMPSLKELFIGGSSNQLTSTLPADAFSGDVNLEQLSLIFNRRSNVTFSFTQIRGLPKLLYLTVEFSLCMCDNSVSQWWTGLTKQPDLQGHCLNTSRKMKDYLTNCQP